MSDSAVSGYLPYRLECAKCKKMLACLQTSVEVLPSGSLIIVLTVVPCDYCNQEWVLIPE